MAILILTQDLVCDFSCLQHRFQSHMDFGLLVGRVGNVGSQHFQLALFGFEIVDSFDF